MIPYKQTLGDGGEEQLFFSGLRWGHSFPASGLGGEKKVKVENKSIVTIKNKQDKMRLQERGR